MIVVSDSTPLMHFAKIGQLNLLFSLYDEILITKEVLKETVEAGIMLGEDDAVVIQRYIGKNINVKMPQMPFKWLIEKYHIHQGEAESIQLAKEVGAHLILMNEREGRIAAKKEGLEVKGSIGVIFNGLKADLINKKEALSILNSFKEKPQTFWIEPEIIEIAMERI